MENLTTQLAELFAAIQNADVGQVRRLLAANISPIQSNPEGTTALMVAIQVGNFEILQMLCVAATNHSPPSQIFFDARTSATPEFTLSASPIEANLSRQAISPTPNPTKPNSIPVTKASNATPSSPITLSPTGLSAAAPSFLPKAGKFSDSPIETQCVSPAATALQSKPDANSTQPFYRPENAPENAPEHAPDLALEAAVSHNDINTVTALLKAGADPHPQNWYDTPVLVTAAAKGYTDIVQALIDFGANVNLSFNRLPLSVAAKHGHLEIVQRLLNSGAYIHAKDDDGKTALMEAAAEGHLAIVQTLVAEGADVKAICRGETALMLAQKNGHQRVQQFLSSGDFSKSRQMSANRLPSNQVAVDRLAHLMATQAVSARHPALTNPTGTASSVNSVNTAASAANPTSAVLKDLITAVSIGHLPRLSQAIKQCGAISKATINETVLNPVDKRCRTALSMAIQAGYVKAVELLIAAGADPNQPDKTAQGLPTLYPLMVAACSPSVNHRSEIIRLLVMQGARVNQSDSHGQTALMYAAQSLHVDAIATLLAVNAKTDLHDHLGRTALILAQQNPPDQSSRSSQDRQQAQVIAHLQRASREQQQAIALLQAVTQNNLSQVKQLLKAGINPNAQADGMTALCQAAAKGFDAIAQQLITAGADVNYRLSQTDLTPLIYAAYYGKPGMVKFLINAGADVQARGGGHLNALGYAKFGKQQRRKQRKAFNAIIALLNRYEVTSSPQAQPENSDNLYIAEDVTSAVFPQPKLRSA